MNERQLFRALGDVDDSLLEAAERLPHRKKPRHTGLWIAACLCLAALSLAAPYVALFTKGASSADPKAAVREPWSKCWLGSRCVRRWRFLGCISRCTWRWAQSPRSMC